MRFTSWDLTRVWLIDARTGAPLCRIYPLDKVANADRRRRALPETTQVQPPLLPPREGMAPLLRRLTAEYAATGLPPAYLPKDEVPQPQPNPEEEIR